MATKISTMERGRDVTFSPVETKGSTMLSSWLAGLMLLVVIALVASLLNSAANLSRTTDGVNSPIVLPDGAPGSVRVRDGNDTALDAIAGVPAGNGASSSGSIDSKLSTPQTDRLPGEDNRKPQPVPAPI